MAFKNRLHHSPNLAADVVSWCVVAENVGVGASAVIPH
jgi:hypothetical protein